MGNPIKYSTSVTSGSYQKGNVSVGVNSIGYGPTSTTGWHNSPTPTGGNFIVIEVIDGNTPPRFYAPSTLTDWVNLAKQEGATGANTGSIVAVKNWFASQANYVVTNIDFPSTFPSIVGNGQITYLDSEFTTSYPGSGTAWTDISGLGNNTTLVNGPTFNAGAKYIQFDGIDDYTSIPNPGNTGSIQFTYYWPGGAQSFIAGGGDGAMLYNGGSGNVIHWYPANGGYDFAGFLPSRAGWYNITVTWGGTNDNKMYMNGALVMSSTAYSIPKSSTWFFAGNYYQPQAIRLQSIQAYNKILTQAEVLQNHHKGNIVTDGLVLSVDAGNIVSYESGSTLTYNLSGSSSGITGGTLSVGISGSLLNGLSYINTNGGVWDLDGADDRISLGYQSTLNNLDITQEAWVNADTMYSWSGIISNMPSWGTGFSLQMGPIQNIAAMVSGVYLTTSWAPKTGVWYHIVATHRSSDDLNVLYVNGVQENSFIKSISYSTNAVTEIGVFYTGGGLPLDGKIGLVRTYNRALSAAEVTQNFNAQRSRFGI